MGTTSKDTWFDSEGESTFWQNIPMRTVKKAFFRKGATVRALVKMVVNNITYDFRETANGGAVIVPPDFTAIEFISPDGRIDYKTLLNGNLGDAITETINVLNREPISSWDKFAAWLGKRDEIANIKDGIAKCELSTIDGTLSTVVDGIDFSNITNMTSLLEATNVATKQAHSHALSDYRLDTASFGWVIKLTSKEDENGEVITLNIGFIFRE